MIHTTQTAKEAYEQPMTKALLIQPSQMVCTSGEETLEGSAIDDYIFDNPVTWEGLL